MQTCQPPSAAMTDAAENPMAASDTELARRAWRAMSDIVLDHDRKLAVSQALDLSWARVRALQQLAAQPLTLRSLAASLAADPPYATLIVDGLEERGLAKRIPHPDDRRAKLVQLTAAGHAASERAEAILDQPSGALLELPRKDLAALLRTLERLQQHDA
jgi:DNA-binding MarR family transcriptional regulator